MKKEIQDMKDASAHQKRLKEKYPKLDGMWCTEESKFKGEKVVI
jgi:hypothetical protein